MKVTADGQVEVGDLATLKVIADPLRLGLLTVLTEPKTVKEAAAELGVPTTRLYYHLRVLEEHELVRVVSTRLVSGIEEKTYESIGSSWAISPELSASAIESSGVLASVISLVQAELSVALEEAPSDQFGDPDSGVPLLTLSRLAMDRDELIRFQDRMYQLVEEFACTSSTPPPGKQMFHLFLAGYRQRAVPAAPKRGRRSDAPRR